MNFKKTWKRFWTLSRRSEGFTLVELIVVIAILAILAGVAVPAYSGYVAKANEAGDLQLLAAVNTAFAAAVMEEDQVATTSLPDGSVTFNTDDMTVSQYNDAFQKYFAGNEGNEGAGFNVIENLYFAGGIFTKDEGITLNYGGTTINVSTAAVNALKNSTYGTTIGGEKLLKEVATLTGWADADGNAIVDTMGDDYYLSMAEYLGFGDDPTKLDDYFAKLEEDGKATQIDTMMTNGLVLYAAENFATLDDNSITTLLNSENIYSSLDDDPAKQLAQASMVYGLYTGYVNSSYYNSADAKTSDPVAAVKAISSSTYFKDYVNSAQGKADLEAYKEAMGVINDASGNSAAMEDVLANGYDNAELIGLLQQVMGK